MVFSDRSFVFLFLPIALAAIFLCTKVRLRYLSILTLSVLFYFYSAGELIWVLGFCVILSYIAGILVERFKAPLILGGSIIGLMVPLFFYKYSLFFAASVGVPLDSTAGKFMNVALPAGISFFTFQAVSYVMDVYRGELKADRNLMRYSAYLSFFPQLIAGPIVRYKEVSEDFEKNNQSIDRFTSGILRFVHGLLKKLIVADSAGRIADACFNLGNDEISFAVVILGSIAYTVQIYFDFSGYSDMAIGLGKMFGIKFPENFNSPYESRSITEFWRRWHITLSNWFRDYLYIPLGGNRVDKARLYSNLLIVFLATGVWHGAAWTFVLWGVYHGLFILLERYIWGGQARRLELARYRYIYLLPVVIFGWIIFRSTSMDQVLAFSLALISPLGDGAFNINNTVIAASTPSACLALAIGCLSFFKKSAYPIGVMLEKNLESKRLKWFSYIYILIGLIVVAVASLSSNFSPFLYFQF